MTRRAFLKTAAGTIVAATVTDAAGCVASFLDGTKQFYIAQIYIDSSVGYHGPSIVMLHSLEYLAVGDFVVLTEDGFIRKQRRPDERIIGAAVAMEETKSSC